jgi:hypothetical protein
MEDIFQIFPDKIRVETHETQFFIQQAMGRSWGVPSKWPGHDANETPPSQNRTRAVVGCQVDQSEGRDPTYNGI